MFRFAMEISRDKSRLYNNYSLIHYLTKSLKKKFTVSCYLFTKKTVSRVPQKEIATAPLTFAYPRAAEPRNDRTGPRSSVIRLITVRQEKSIQRFNDSTI